MPRKTNEELFEEAERALISDAIAETEQEIFDEAFDLAPDDNDGDRSLEEMDADDTLDPDDIEGEEGEEIEASEEGEGEEGDDGQNVPGDQGQNVPGDPRVPPGRLREETERRRTIEAERDAALARNREVEARLQLLERGGNRPQPQQQPERPDMFADPQAWERSLRAEIAGEFDTRRINGSFEDAIEEHGRDKFGTAYEALVSAGRSGDTGAVQRVWNSPNPGRALMRWHDQQAIVRDIGSDPQAFIDRQIQERLSDPAFRRQLISGMRDDAMRGDGGGQPRTRVRLPPSLNGSSGGASHRGRDPNVGRRSAMSTAAEEREIFESAFDDT